VEGRDHDVIPVTFVFYVDCLKEQSNGSVWAVTAVAED
jgi:hypothetical protein